MEAQYQYQTLSIASLGDSTLKDAKNKPQIHYVNYDSEIFADLQREKSASHNKIQTHRTNDVTDIDGARPKVVKERNYVSKSLCVDDIDGAKARFRDRFHHTNRHTNPLQPEYKMPTAEITPAQPPPFHRDPLMIDDIEGTRTSQRRVFPGRDFSDTSDIEGTKPGWKPLHLRVRKESDPHDIFPLADNPIKKTFARSSTRQTNPMQPTYYINSTFYYDDDKTKPKKLPQYIPDNHFLMTNDIDGAQAGYRSEHQLSLPISKRKEFKNTNFVNDIEGAQANTRSNTFVTTRCSNPLQPVYQSLDGGDAIIGGPVEGLVPTHLVDKNTFNFKSCGTIPGRNQLNSSTQSKETTTIFGRSHSAKSSAREERGEFNSSSSSPSPSTQNLAMNLHSTSTTSQYLTPHESREGRRFSEENGSKSYAEKIHLDTQVLITNSSLQHNNSHHSQQENQEEDQGFFKTSSKSHNTTTSTTAAAVPRRSLSAVPRLSRDYIPPAPRHSDTSSTRKLSITKNNNSSSSNNSQVSIAGRSHQSNERKLSRSDSLSAKRQVAELEAEISAVRGL